MILTLLLPLLLLLLLSLQLLPSLLLLLLLFESLAPMVVGCLADMGHHQLRHLVEALLITITESSREATSIK
jgi:hypothetical protein